VRRTPTASQTVGPFFSIGLDALLRRDAPDGNGPDDRFTVRGRLLDGDREPVPDAVLEIWAPPQGREGADALGYPIGFGRVATNARGEFEFSVSRPAARGEQGGAVEASHLLVLVFMRGLLRHLVTRLYFPDHAANAADAVLALVPEDRRATLIAEAARGASGQFSWDIHLQGDRETVFFDT